ncbi:MAG: hypothetical protein US63_C0026G0007 [Candidatus Moranbacteria bacterium GW2011_GWC2_37_8]|nr:MAG: hypothetical protein US63_C0026G0007 [Candidatus Moranbacteria bacterium GW2011_GWC2_37_8]KKQ62890.1 MAG: Metal dependent phosphohydrolase [Parcubacteria group bacterium GW2011_GWC1_38_22]KKQ81480.1 MAG: hypothetical protein UT03_C0001G0020 [Candidatus Moranbacteria bacterium GW2011_GWD2_38_7]
MDQEKTQQFEDEIKRLYFENFDDNLMSFWNVHLKPVIDIAKKLAVKYEADLEIVWLAAVLHDIGQFDDIENHDTVGSEKAYKILFERGYSEEIAAKVRDVILTHRVKSYLPETLEQKIVATADAMAHFTTAHYVWMAYISKKPFAELMKKFSGKIQRDFQDKIFFEEEREIMRPQYEMLKKWFEIV